MPKNKYRIVKDSSGELGSPEVLYTEYHIPYTIHQALFYSDNRSGIGDVVVVFMKRKPGKYKPVKMEIKERLGYQHCECCTPCMEQYFVPVRKSC